MSLRTSSFIHRTKDNPPRVISHFLTVRSADPKNQQVEGAGGAAANKGSKRAERKQRNSSPSHDHLLGTGRRARGDGAPSHALRGPLLLAHDHHGLPGALLQETRPHTRRNFRLRSLHDDRHRLAALPHEQRALPARARLCQGGLLRAHESLSRDLLAGLGCGTGRLYDTLSQVPQAALDLQDHVEDNLLGREDDLHGAPLRHAVGWLREGDRDMSAAAARLQCRGCDGRPYRSRRQAERERGGWRHAGTTRATGNATGGGPLVGVQRHLLGESAPAGTSCAPDTVSGATTASGGIDALLTTGGSSGEFRSQ
ncbi:uncharacterized protein LOC100121120 isoform X1 [Nasonia vitripennis]|uniref:Uncharacterized protein n=1 Tax=Nasonia vitripennis TaxID=7425 RepID=A0A7M7T8K2_NASVI|nr:uncharacterized protein LOC100121120 isoform X1 [Nasonia vitripennis]